MSSTSIDIDKLRNQFDNEVNGGDVVPLYKRALLYGDKIAIEDYNGKYSYRQILNAAHKLSKQLSVYNNSTYANYWFSCFRFQSHRIENLNRY